MQGIQELIKCWVHFSSRVEKKKCLHGIEVTDQPNWETADFVTIEMRFYFFYRTVDLSVNGINGKGFFSVHRLTSCRRA